jgi:hypothetical protein
MDVQEWGDRLDWKVDTTVRKWHDSADHDAGAEPDEVLELHGNLLLNAGITRLINLLTGAGGTAFNAANSRIGVGNSTTAASAAQTDLQGASKYFKLVDSVSPSGQTVTWVATFGSSDANFAWGEWGVDNGSTSGATVTAPLLNRKVAAMGTKVSGSTWTLTVTITIS